MQNKLKLNVLRKMLGRTVVVTDSIKSKYYYGKVYEVKNEDHVIVEDQFGMFKEVNIFDIRSPSSEYP
jgi:hypothetical protein